MKLRNGKIVLPTKPSRRRVSSKMCRLMVCVRQILDNPDDYATVAYYLSELCSLLLNHWDVYTYVKRAELNGIIVRLVKLLQNNPFYEHFKDRFDTVLMWYDTQVQEQQEPKMPTKDPKLYCVERISLSRLFLLALLLLSMIGQAGYSYSLVKIQQSKKP